MEKEGNETQSYEIRRNEEIKRSQLGQLHGGNVLEQNEVNEKNIIFVRI